MSERKPSPDYLAVSSEMLRSTALTLANAGQPEEATATLRARRGLQIARRGYVARLSAADVAAIDRAHRAFSDLLPFAIQGDAPFVLVTAVLAAIEDIRCDEIADTASTRAARLRLWWRCALNARRLGQPVQDKGVWIVGGICDPNSERST